MDHENRCVLRRATNVGMMDGYWSIVAHAHVATFGIRNGAIREPRRCGTLDSRSSERRASADASSCSELVAHRARRSQRKQRRVWGSDRFTCVTSGCVKSTQESTPDHRACGLDVSVGCRDSELVVRGISRLCDELQLALQQHEARALEVILCCAQTCMCS